MTIHSSRRGTQLLPPLPSLSQPIPSAPIETRRSKVRDYLWIFGTWLLSRGLVIFVLQWISPSRDWPIDGYWDPIVGWVNDFVPQPGWDLFAHWDGAWYQKITQFGYDYEHGVDRRATIVFFPAFPIMCWALMKLGLSYAIAGTIISNLTCLGAMYILHRWVKEIHGSNVAGWSLVALGFMPCALFSVMAYTESLFLLATLGTLYYFSRQRYGWAVFWGILMTATRPPGLLIVPALLWISWRQQRPRIAYLSAGAMAISTVLFTLYCGWEFGHPWAWITSHQSWEEGVVSWKLLAERLGYPQVGAWMRMSIIVASFGFLWHYWWEFMPELQAYMTISLALLIFSNSTEGLIRYLYVLPGLSIAFGVFLSRHWLLRWPALVVSTLLLIFLTMQFAWYRWVS
jgi:Gpi18-like mannosyltransferase